MNVAMKTTCVFHATRDLRGLLRPAVAMFQTRDRRGRLCARARRAANSLGAIGWSPISNGRATNTNSTWVHRLLVVTDGLADLPLDLARAVGVEAFDFVLRARAVSTGLAHPDNLHSPEESAFINRLGAKGTEAATLASCAYVERVCSRLDAPAAAQMAGAAHGAYALGRSDLAYVHALGAAQHARRAAKAAGADDLLEIVH